MAIFIFQQNTHYLYRIAESQSVMNENKNFIDAEYDLVTVSQENFNDIRLKKKIITNRQGSSITFQDFPLSFTKHSDMQQEINGIISVIDDYLLNNSEKPMASNIINYKNYLKTINPSTVITEEDNSVTPAIAGVPLNSSVEEYCENQGQTAINLLQLL